MNEEPPPDYETVTVTRHPTGLSINPEYPRTIPGIIKITEMVVSTITFISSIVHWYEGHGWVEFVSINALISAVIYFVLSLVNLRNFTSRFPGPWELIEFIYCIIFTVFYLIAAIVASAFAARYQGNVGAAAFFAFLGTAIFLVDTIFQYRGWNASDSSVRTGTTGATIMTTTTHHTSTRYACSDSEPPKY